MLDYVKYWAKAVWLAGFELLVEFVPQVQEWAGEQAQRWIQILGGAAVVWLVKNGPKPSTTFPPVGGTTVNGDSGTVPPWGDA